MKMLQENMKIKKIYWGNLLLVYIYTKKITFYNKEDILTKINMVISFHTNKNNITNFLH